MGARKIIGIDGESTAGKSTLAAKLAAFLPKAGVVSLDDFCRERSGKEGEWWGDTVAGHGFDWQRLRDQVIQPFLAGQQDIVFDAFDWNLCKGTIKKSVPPCDILIVEGLSALRLELREFMDVKIWLESDAAGQIQRMIDRGDAEMVGYFEREFSPLVQKYLSHHKPREVADFAVTALEMTDADVAAFAEKLTAQLKGMSPPAVARMAAR